MPVKAQEGSFESSSPLSAAVPAPRTSQARPGLCFLQVTCEGLIVDKKMAALVLVRSSGSHCGGCLSRLAPLFCWYEVRGYVCTYSQIGRGSLAIMGTRWVEFVDFRSPPYRLPVELLSHK
ncbi:hypothetical protein LIA77_02396 [Sarocladium implicatum]|nr:hypothetical protein LIA77_02396 [Sarocladium implicatum]